MEVSKVLEILQSDCIDDPEDLLIWLATDGIAVLEEYREMKAAQLSLEATASSGVPQSEYYMDEKSQCLI